MQMSYATGKEKNDDVDFSWGMKRKKSGADEEIEYASFTYDSVEYFLYDCVYLYENGQSEPYIGMLIRIWDDPIEGRKVLVLWFFRPSEISYHLRCENVLENELFLASGNGVGLANENPLDAIAGKCNVVCISKDERNRQPSDEEVKRADYIFYRVFDVENFSILDKLGERIAFIEVRFLLNKKDSRLFDLGPSSKADSEIVAVNIRKPLISNVDTSSADELLEPDSNKRALAVKNGSGTNLLQGVMSHEKHDGAEPNNTYPATEPVPISGQKTRLRSPDSNQAYLHNVTKSAGIAENKGSDKLKGRDSVNMSDRAAMKNHGKNIADSSTNNVKHPVLSTSSADRGKSEYTKDFDRGVATTHKVKSRFDPSEGSLSKKLKLDNTSMPSHKYGKDRAHTSDSAPVVSRKDTQPAANVTTETRGGVKSKVMKGTPNTMSLKPNLRQSKDVQVEAHGHVEEVSRPPRERSFKKNVTADEPHGCFVDPDLGTKRYTLVLSHLFNKLEEQERSSWFKPIPWGEKMKDAQGRGTLVLLQNLDPTYTSSEVEDIVLRAFGDRCTAKMIQRTAMSSPYSGGAFVVFDTREAAHKVINMLKRKCLMLPNGRPIVGRFWAPKSDGKQPPFPGHLEIHKPQRAQRESKAVSTAHSSQSNTVEYEMALEWCVLQERSDFCWKKLHKEHEDERRKLASRLKRQ